MRDVRRTSRAPWEAKTGFVGVMGALAFFAQGTSMTRLLGVKVAGIGIFVLVLSIRHRGLRPFGYGILGVAVLLFAWG